jgi:hypothetical protein
MTRIVLIRLALVALIFCPPTLAKVEQPPSKAPAPDNFRVSIVLQQLNSDPAFLYSVHLTSPDEQAARTIVADFVRLFLAYASGVDRHDLTPDQFFLIRDDLIEKARTKFEKMLTKTGFSRLNKFINERAINFG